jgi:hypothetical protein
MASLLINTTTEGTYPFEVILSEGESIAREKVTLITGQNLKSGTVLGKITASGKYMAHDNAATGATAGAEVAVAVLLADCDATSADQTTLILARIAEVSGDLLVWKSGISAPNKTAGIAALAVNFIIVR